MKFARGEVIAVYDAENRPEKTAMIMSIHYPLFGRNVNRKSLPLGLRPVIEAEKLGSPDG